MSHEEKFCVWQKFEDGQMEKVRDWVPAEEAVKAAAHYTSSVGARLGTTIEVLIVDSGDMTNFHWKYGEGIIFPQQTGERNG